MVTLKGFVCNMRLLFLANCGFAFPEHTQAYRGRLVQKLAGKWAKLGGVHD